MKPTLPAPLFLVQTADQIPPYALTVPEAAAYLRLSERTVFNAIKKGRLASALVEGRRVIRVADAQAFVDAHYAAEKKWRAAS